MKLSDMRKITRGKRGAMDFVRTKCKNCGYEIVMPEGSENIVCGSCGNVNRYSKISSVLKKYNETELMKNGGFIPPEKIKTSAAPILKGEQNPAKPEMPSDEVEGEFPENSGFSKIMTFIFILIPFIMIAVERFNLPSYIAVIIIIIAVAVTFILKRK
jgi:ribosomal protein S27E